VASQCIENNGRRIGYSSAYAMLEGYKADYKPAPKGATHLEKNQIGIVKKEKVVAAAGAEPARGPSVATE
jgi:hypothetical protein